MRNHDGTVVPLQEEQFSHATCDPKMNVIDRSTGSRTVKIEHRAVERRDVPFLQLFQYNISGNNEHKQLNHHWALRGS